MKLAFHYHIPFIKKNEIFYTDSQQGVFLDSLAPNFDELICFLHTPNDFDRGQMDYTIKARNIKFVSLGIHDSFPKRIFRVNQYLKIISSYLGKFDLILLRTPSPLSNFIISLCKPKCAIYVVGDYVDGLPSMKGNLFKILLINFWAHTYEFLQNRHAKDISVITNSQLKHKKLKKYNPLVQLVRSTTLSNSDFFIREDTFQSSKTKVLYTGRIDEAKGLEDILNALIHLSDTGHKFEFHIAGFYLGSDSGFIERLKSKSSQAGYPNLIVWHGKLKIGEELNSLYRKCDIYCIASRSGFEGFPRTLWEAMANSLPIIASKVGSIPYFLKDNINACLVNPKQKDQLINAFTKIIASPDLRKKLIVNGREIAQSNTLENSSSQMANILKKYNKRVNAKPNKQL